MKTQKQKKEKAQTNKMAERNPYISKTKTNVNPALDRLQDT